MPTKPPQICPEPGCGKAGCTEHRRQQGYDARRGTAAQRGYDKRHRRWRIQVATKARGLCEECHRRDILNVGTVADHIIPLSKGGTWEYSNGQWLCKPCHDRKTVKESRGAG